MTAPLPLPPDPETAPRPKIKDMEVMVADVIVEAHDTTTLVLFTGNDHLDYQPGHFVTIWPHQFTALDRFIKYYEDIKGKKEPPRAYSLSSAPHEKYLAITVKEERYLSDVGRVRDVQQGPDGLLYLVTDESDGRLIRVVPKG